MSAFFLRECGKQLTEASREYGILGLRFTQAAAGNYPVAALAKEFDERMRKIGKCKEAFKVAIQQCGGVVE